jgi:3-methyladenine DNA glycosylase AlkD
MPVTRRPRAVTPKRTTTTRASSKATGPTSSESVGDQAKDALRSLERSGTKSYRDGLLRYGIHAPKAFGVSMATIKVLAKRLGRNHELAGALWETGWYEARLLASLVAQPERITTTQMDRWCRDFDNWAVCDTACFHLFDRTPHAFRKVNQWAGRRDEFVRRAAFALLASLALHDKTTDDGAFAECLPLIEEGANDDRNFVKKSVSWALRAIGRRTVELNAASITVARRLSSSAVPAARWVGKDALRELTKPAVLSRLSKKRSAKSAR